MVGNLSANKVGNPFSGGQPFAEGFSSTVATVDLVFRISVRTLAQVGYRRRDVSAKHRPPTINYQLSTINYSLFTINY
ncbi:MAG: hypothetical protein LBI18_08300 [Planctomycetaceae bacterium]|jgi:hypothetical protein|nr:hypothetical protein [Planctomycetaceae bacterium]